MTQEAIIHQISEEGLEDLKSEVWNLNDIDKIGIIIRDGEKPVLIVQYKHTRRVAGKGLHTELKKISVK